MSRRKAIILVTVVAGLLLTAALALWTVKSSPGPETAPVAPTQEPAAAPQTAAPPPKDPGGDNNAVRPSDTELSDLEAAMASADTSELAPYLPLSPGESAESSFASRLATLGLTVDSSSLVETATDIWSVAATDSGGQRWSIGLVRTDGQLRMFSAEEATR